MRTGTQGVLRLWRGTQAGPGPGPGLTGQVNAVQWEMRGKAPASVYTIEQCISGFNGNSGQIPKGEHFHFHWIVAPAHGHREHTELLVT